MDLRLKSHHWRKLVYREHKYQAWHKKQKRMCQVIGINFYLGDVNIGDPEQKGFNETWYASDIELREYTGLKDRNGKEVYEGDIVRHETQPFQPIMIGEICWEEASFYFRPFDKSKGSKWVIYKPANEHLEVIGNVYETPWIIKQDTMPEVTHVILTDKAIHKLLPGEMVRDAKNQCWYIGCPGWCDGVGNLGGHTVTEDSTGITVSPSILCHYCSTHYFIENNNIRRC